MRDIRLQAPDPIAALAGLVPRLTATVGPHGFTAEAAGKDWAHWVAERDDSVVLRAHASLSGGGLVSITMTGTAMPLELERDVRRAVASPASD